MEGRCMDMHGDAGTRYSARFLNSLMASSAPLTVESNPTALVVRPNF